MSPCVALAILMRLGCTRPLCSALLLRETQDSGIDFRRRLLVLWQRRNERAAVAAGRAEQHRAAVAVVEDPEDGRAGSLADDQGDGPVGAAEMDQRVAIGISRKKSLKTASLCHLKPAAAFLNFIRMGMASYEIPRQIFSGNVAIRSYPAR